MPDDTPGALVPQAGDDPSAAAAVSPEVRASAAEERLASVVVAYRQLKQEMEGFRERVTRDVERRFEKKREQLLIPFIEILDNLERALDAAQQSGAQHAMIEGLILVRTQLLQTLREEGLTWIPVRGLPFDPECSEVVDMEPVDDSGNDQVVIRELQRGYRLNGRIVRHAQVVVGQYRNPDAAPAPESPATGVVPAPPTPDETTE